MRERGLHGDPIPASANSPGQAQSRSLPRLKLTTMRYSLIFLGQLPAMLLFCFVLEPMHLLRQGCASVHGFPPRMCESGCSARMPSEADSDQDSVVQERRRPHTDAASCRYENFSLRKPRSQGSPFESRTFQSLNTLFHSNFPTYGERSLVCSIHRVGILFGHHSSRFAWLVSESVRRGEDWGVYVALQPPHFCN